jgi:hypothetical protein
MGNSYTISAPDCDTNYFEGAPPSLFCTQCGSYIGSEEFVPQLDIRQCDLDFCFTYDGRLLVSQRGKTYLSQHCATPLNFAAVDRSARYYSLHVVSSVAFDPVRRKTRFEKKCALCGNFESIVGATPAFILESEKVEEMGMYRTDLCFGSGREKSPVFVVGAALKDDLARNFVELDFEEVNPPLK